MYIDENDTRLPRERANSRLLHQLLNGEDTVEYETAQVSEIESDYVETAKLMGRGSRAGICGCRKNFDGNDDSGGLQDYPLAMVYSPTQEWRDLYDYEVGLERGTIFQELDKPFCGGKCGSKGGC